MIPALARSVLKRSSMELHQLAGGGFAGVHARFVHGIEEYDWDGFACRNYSDREREQGRRAFVKRTHDARHWLRAFSELSSLLHTTNAPAEVIGAATQVVRNGALHADLCGRMAAALGGWPLDAAVEEPPWLIAPARHTPRQRLLKTLVGALCIGQSLSAALLAAVGDQVTDPLAQRVLARMHADEASHSIFGWWWLERETQRMRSEERRWVAGWVPRAVAAAARTAVAPSLRGVGFQRGPFGGLSSEQHREALKQCMDRTIIPHLFRCGFDLRCTPHRAA